MGDLTFGDRGQALVVDGEAGFRRAGPADADPQVWILGDLFGLEDAALLGRTSFADLFGRFVVLVHRVRDGVLEVHADRWGAVPFYWTVRDGAVHLARRVKVLVDRSGAAPSVDLTALAEAMAFDFPLNAGTLVDGVRSLEGGTCLRVELSGRRAPEVRRAWSPLDVWRHGPVAFADVREQLVALFLEGCDRATRDGAEVGVTLSGGMDSRCLVAAALHLGRSVRSYHMSEPGGRADVYARRMAELCGIPHEAYAAGPELTAEYYRRLQGLVRVHEGMSFEPEAEVSWLRDRVPRDLVLLHGGYAELSKLGDLRRFHVNRAVQRADAASLPDVLWGRWEGPFGIRLRAFAKPLRDELASRARASFAHRIAAAAAGNGALGGDAIVQVCYLQEQTKVEKFSGCMWNDRVRTRFPFSYPPYVDLLLRVRTADRLQQRFQIQLLQRLRPALYRVPDANTGARADAPAPVTFLVRAAAKVRKEVFRSRMLQEHSDIMGSLGVLAPPLENLLLRDVDERLYDRAGLAELIADAKRTRRVGEAFQSILLLELWREYMGLRGPLPLHG